MAVPKRRMSRARTHKRRANHDKLTPINLSVCPTCGSPVRSHHVCRECGTYRGRQIMEPTTVEDELTA
ncbi:MAG TPA: 50S ribosomal protein L32 [Myxococcales bacterium]|nr:50S ribosomal protein L32 [Myxococcales bacterium]HAN31401.1 50S ribosomal protein L32 [Myxococcales bacterium]